MSENIYNWKTRTKLKKSDTLAALDEENIRKKCAAAEKYRNRNIEKEHNEYEKEKSVNTFPYCE